MRNKSKEKLLSKKKSELKDLEKPFVKDVNHESGRNTSGVNQRGDRIKRRRPQSHGATNVPRSSRERKDDSQGDSEIVRAALWF